MNANDLAIRRAELPAAVPMPLVWRFAAGGLLSTFSAHLVYPLAAVELARAGQPPELVGLFGMLPPLAMLMLIPLLPMIEAHVGRASAVRLGIVAGAAAVAGFVLTDDVRVWLLLAPLVGAQFAIHWTSVDTVLSENVPKDRAGTVIGLYQTLLAAAVAVGPAVASLGAPPLVTAATVALVLLGLSLLPTLGTVACAIDAATPARKACGPGLGRFVLAHPALLAVAVMAGLYEVGTTAMAGVHALHLGFAAAAAVLVASVIATGSLAAQVPIGWLADRLSVTAMTRACGTVLLASAAVLPLAAAWPWLLWPLAAVWGAFGGALQTLVYMHVAVTRRGPEVQLGMMTMALGFTAGTLVGPGLGGIAVGVAPDIGFAAMLAAMALAVLAIVLRRGALG